MTNTPGSMDYDGPMHVVTGGLEEARMNRTEITTLCGITYVPTRNIVEKKDRGVCSTCLSIHRGEEATK